MRLIIETEGEFAPMFRAVAKAVNAKVKIMDDAQSAKVEEKSPKIEKEPIIEPSSAKPGEKPSDFFKGTWENDPSRTG